MRYITNSDYGFIIQNIQLSQLLQVQPNTPIGINQKLLRAENTAIEETISYLKQRWDVNAEFTNTTPWSYTASYNASDRVILDYVNYSTQSTYNIGSNVIYNGIAYMSNAVQAATTSTPVGQITWDVLGNQYQLFYGSYPFPLYDGAQFYSTGDGVFWKGHTWSCVTNTLVLSTTEAIQFNRLEWLPPQNIFPDSKVNSSFSYWSDNGTYSIPVGTLPTDNRYWTEGDNRSQQIVMLVMDIAIYNLHKNIAPQNIPELRLHAYKDAIKTLRMANTGDTTLNMLPLQPQQGLKVRFSGDVRRQNDW